MQMWKFVLVDYFWTNYVAPKTPHVNAQTPIKEVPEVFGKSVRKPGGDTESLKSAQIAEFYWLQRRTWKTDLKILFHVNSRLGIFSDTEKDSTEQKKKKKNFSRLVKAECTT